MKISFAATLLTVGAYASKENLKNALAFWDDWFSSEVCAEGICCDSDGVCYPEGQESAKTALQTEDYYCDEELGWCCDLASGVCWDTNSQLWCAEDFCCDEETQFCCD